MTKARLIFLAVMILVVVQALLAAGSAPPVGFFDGNG
jgi:hypothetical protein